MAEEVAKRVEESKEEKMVVEETAPDEAKTALDQSVDEAKEKAAKLAKHVGRVRARRDVQIKKPSRSLCLSRASGLFPHRAKNGRRRRRTSLETMMLCATPCAFWRERRRDSGGSC